MLDLYLSEWRRFRPLTLGVAVGHLLLQWLAYHYDIRVLELGHKEQLALILFYLVAAELFSLAQLRAYLAPGRWLWLIHRPLPRAAIASALALAASTHLAIMFAVPALLTVLATDWFTTDTVSLHHYLMVLFLFQASLISWLLCAITTFGRTMLAGLAAVLPCPLLFATTSGVTTVLLATVTMAVLAVIALDNFKADRKAPPESTRATALAAASMMPGFHLLLLVFALALFEFGLRYTDAMPGHRGHRPAGGLYEASRVDQRTNILASLANATDPRKAEWEYRLPKATPATILPEIGRFAVRYQLSNVRTPAPLTRADGMKVVFDQDLMRFVVTDEQTGTVSAQFGLHGDADLTPFPAIPVSTAQYLLAPHTVYSHDAEGYQPVLRAVVPATEQVLAVPVKARQHYYLLTSQRVVVFLPDPVLPFAPWKEVASVPVPGPVNDLAIVDIAELHNLTLLTFTGGKGMKFGNPAGLQTAVVLDAEGKSTVVAQRTLSHDYPLVNEHLAWLLSPAIYAAVEGLEWVYNIGNTPSLLERHTGIEQRPLTAWLVAALLALVSGALAWWSLRYESWRGWTLACLVFGLPALFSMCCLLPLQRASRPAIASPLVAA